MHEIYYISIKLTINSKRASTNITSDKINTNWLLSRAEQKIENAFTDGINTTKYVQAEFCDQIKDSQIIGLKITFSSGRGSVYGVWSREKNRISLEIK